MAKEPENHRAPWTAADVKAVRRLASENTPTRVIGIKLDRTPAAVQGKASAEGISLKPSNQKPYNRRKS